MKVLDRAIERADLRKSDVVFDDMMVKAVVDVEKQLLALDAEMHADLEQFLLEQGSKQEDLWGINLYIDDEDELIEFDSMINVRPRQGNRSRSVEDSERQKKITEVVNRWIK